MRAALTSAEFDLRVAHFRARFEAEGWVVSDDHLASLAGVLPMAEGMPEASVITESEAAFVLGDALLVASWKESDDHLVTDVLSLPGVPLTVVWNDDWLAGYGSVDLEDVPANRPVTVTLRGPDGAPYVLPPHDAWGNPVACIHFASMVILRSHGFRPAVGTSRETPVHRTWKR